LNGSGDIQISALLELYPYSLILQLQFACILHRFAVTAEYNELRSTSLPLGFRLETINVGEEGGEDSEGYTKQRPLSPFLYRDNVRTQRLGGGREYKYQEDQN
jgi:hypothetical protein